MYIRISLVLALSIGVLFVFALNSFALNFAYEAKSDFPYYLGSDTLDEENGGDFTGVNSYAIDIIVPYGPYIVKDIDVIIKIEALDAIDPRVYIAHKGVSVPLYRPYYIDEFGNYWNSNNTNGSDDLQQPTPILFDDESPYTIEDGRMWARPMIGSLSSFDNLPLGGAWTLNITGGDPDDPVFLYSYGIRGRAEDIAPVPEPGTLFLVGIGVAGITLFRRKRLGQLLNP